MDFFIFLSNDDAQTFQDFQASMETEKRNSLLC